MSRRARPCAAAVAIALAVAACGEPASDDPADSSSAGQSAVTFRLWDEEAASAYQESFDAFNALRADIHVEVEVVPEESYAERATADLADGTMADVFWTTSDAVAGHAHAGELLDLDAIGEQDDVAWEPAVTELYTRDEELLAVPQVWESAVLFYNTDLVEAAGVDPAALGWAPPPADPPASPDPEAAGEDASPAPTASPTPEPATPPDTLRAAVRALTRDSAGHAASEEDFDGGAVVEHGYNTDLTAPAVWLPFLVQLGGAPGDDLTLSSPEATAVFDYLTGLPVSAAGEATDRELFTSGRLALFQATSRQMRNVAEHPELNWGLAPVPAGPDGARTVVDGVAAAGNATTDNPEATIEVLRWLASPDGQSALASHGIGIPAATGAHDLFLDMWADQGVDAAAALDTAEAVTSASGPRAHQVLQAVRPVLAELFAGQLALPEALSAAQRAADQARGS